MFQIPRVQHSPKANVKICLRWGGCSDGGLSAKFLSMPMKWKPPRRCVVSSSPTHMAMSSSVSSD
ncbi:unnamed protein product [Brassica rapa subsp. trilocularis]